MKRPLAFIVASCLCLAAVCTAMALSSCTPEQTQPEPGPEPEPEAVPVSKGAYKRVVILGVDGAGAFFSKEVTPNCMNIFGPGATTFAAKSSYPSISAQCWGSMLHGVLPQFHRLTNDITGVRHYDPESLYPSIFRITRAAMPDAEMVSFCNWSNINYGIIEENIGVNKQNIQPDPALTEQVLNYLTDGNPTILFVAWDSVDAAGHSYGYGSEKHASALSEVDKMIQKIYDKLRMRGMMDETLLIVSTDHGGTMAGSHGGDTPQERNNFIGVLGKTVQKGGTILYAEEQDIAAIAAYALGVEIPDSWTGHVPSGVFQGVEAEKRKEAVIPVSEARKHTTVATPDVSQMKKLMDGHKLVAYLPFDDNVNDAFGITQTVLTGKNYFYDAYFGKGISLVDGYVTLKGVKFGKESFSVSCWVKADAVNGDPAIISNKNWYSGYNEGFVLSLRSGDVKFNAGTAGKDQRMDVASPLPIDYNMGWMHVLLVVDRGANKVRIYYDFKLECSYSIPESMRDLSFDALKLNVGQDGNGNYEYKLPCQLDEMLITADVLDEEDINKMKEFYR